MALREHKLYEMTERGEMNIKVWYAHCHSIFVFIVCPMQFMALDNIKHDDVQANLESVQCRVFQICKVFDYQYCKSRSHTHTHTDKHSSDFIYVQCHELHWTDNHLSVCLCVCLCVCPQNVSSTVATTIFVRSSWNLERGSEM